MTDFKEIEKLVEKEVADYRGIYSRYPTTRDMLDKLNEVIDSLNYINYWFKENTVPSKVEDSDINSLL